MIALTSLPSQRRQPYYGRRRRSAAAEFYKGKTIRVIVGTSPGDYDTWVRLIVRYLPQYIPGQPNFVVENMPGAGSLIAANHLYNRAARDGTVLGSVSRNIPHYAFAKKANANFDPLKFQWIGSPEVNNRGCFARADSGVRTPRDLFERELLVGTDGAGTSLSEMPVLLKNLLGMKFRTVDGYKGSNDVVLAIQRNEVQGICQTLTAFSQSAQPMLDNGTVRLLFTTERDPVPRPQGADDFRVRHRRRAAHDPRLPGVGARDRAAVVHAARCARRSRRVAAARLQRRHEGSGVARRCQEARLRHQSAHRRADRGGAAQGRGVSRPSCSRSSRN